MASKKVLSGLDIAGGNVTFSGGGTITGMANVSGTGNVALVTSPTFVTPTLGVASATSLALSGALSGATTGSFSSTVATGALTITGAAIASGNVTAGGAASTRTVVKAAGGAEEFYSTDTYPRWRVSRDWPASGQSGLMLGIGTAEPDSGIWLATGGTLALRLAGTDRLTIPSTGVVTIGTASIASMSGTPDFTGNATALTQTAGNNSTRLATTAFVTTAVAAVSGVSLSSANTWTNTNTFNAGFSSANSVGGLDLGGASGTSAYTGASLGDKITLYGGAAAGGGQYGFGIQSASLVAFVNSAAAFVVRTTATSGALSSGTTAVSLGANGVANVTSGYQINGTSIFASPTFTGTPISTTAAVDTNTTQIATTAYVIGQAYAKLASPTFTGTPTLPTGTVATTQSLNDSSTKLATTAFVVAQFANIAANTQTGTTYTLVLSDAGKAVEMNNASAMTVTVPPNSSVAYPTGTVIEINRYGAGTLTIAAGSGVTLDAPGAKLALNVRYSTASIRKRATDEWIVSGDLT